MKVLASLTVLFAIIILWTSCVYAEEFDRMSPGTRGGLDNSIVSGDLLSNDILLSRSGWSDQNQTLFDIMIATGSDDIFQDTIIWSGSIASWIFATTASNLLTGTQYYRQVVSRVSWGPDIVSPIAGFIIYPQHEVDCRKRISEGRRNIWSMNRAQQAYQLEQTVFSQIINALWISMPDSSSYYQYGAFSNNLSGYVINTAKSLQESSGWLSIIWLSRIMDNEWEITNKTIMCSQTGSINMTWLQTLINTGSYPTTIDRTCNMLWMNDEQTNPTSLQCPFDPVLNQVPAPTCMEVTKLRPAALWTPPLCIQRTWSALWWSFAPWSVITLLFDYKNTTLNQLQQQLIESKRRINQVPADFTKRTSYPIFFKVFKSDPAPSNSKRWNVQ
jgi:hypothetical protein